MSRVFKVDYIPDPDRGGRPLWNAKIFVGVANQDPTIPSNQIQLTGDIGFPVGQSIPVPQPVRTNAGGITVYNNSPLDLNVPGQAYAIQIFDRNDNLIYNFPNVDGSVALDTNAQEEITGLTIWPETGGATTGQTIPAGSDGLRVGNTLYRINPEVINTGLITNITTDPNGTGELIVDNTDFYDLTLYTVSTEASRGDGFVAGGLIFPTDLSSLNLGAQSTECPIDAAIFNVDTGSGGELLYLWESSGSLPAAPFTIEDISENSKAGYDFTIDGNIYEFTTAEIALDRSLRRFSGWGVSGNGLVDDSPSLKVAIESGAKNGNYGDIYLLETQLSVSIVGDVNIDFSQTIVRRDASLNSGTAFLITGDGTGDCTIRFGKMEDLSGTSDNFLLIDSFASSYTSRIKAGEDVENPIKVTSCGITHVYKCDLTGPETVGQAIDCRGESEVKIYKNTIRKYRNQISGTHTDVDAKLWLVEGNTLLDSFDTTIFWRSISLDATPNFVDEFICIGNHLENSGKGAIKVEIPNGNQTTMRVASITGNTLKGFGNNEGSSAIHINNAVPGTGAVINKVISTGNSIDGRLTDGTYNVAGFSRGHFIQGCNTVILNDVCQNMPCGGSLITISSNVKNYSTYNSCNNSTFQDPACVTYETSVSEIEDYSTAKGCINGSGVYFNKVRNYKACGTYTDNERYGIEEDGSGAGGEKIQLGQYIGASMTGNTLGPILYAIGDTPSSFEWGCKDDNGTRSGGDTARRNALGFIAAIGQNRGFTYQNTDTGNLDVWNGNAWVSATLA